MKFDDDESLERDLFSLRAEVIATPPLDIDGVFARAVARRAADVPRRGLASPRLARVTAWVSAGACAAASIFAVLRVPSLAPADATTTTLVRDIAPLSGASAEEGDGLACRSIALATYGGGAACVAPPFERGATLPSTITARQTSVSVSASSTESSDDDAPFCACDVTSSSVRP